jgi:hypothetical protein
MSKVFVITALQEELEAVLRLKLNGKEDWSRRQTENGYLLYEAEFKDDLGNPFEIIASAQPAKGIVASAAHTTRMLGWKGGTGWPLIYHLHMTEITRKRLNELQKDHQADEDLIELTTLSEARSSQD